jgi:predicted membrane protein
MCPTFTENLSIQVSTFAEHKLHVYQSTFICLFTCNFSTYTHICTSALSSALFFHGLPFSTILSLCALVYQSIFIYSYKTTQIGKKVQLCKSRNSREFARAVSTKVREQSREVQRQWEREERQREEQKKKKRRKNKGLTYFRWVFL